MAKVKCFYCNEMFDKDLEPFEKVSSRRYAHKSCYEKVQAGKTSDEIDYENLVNYIKRKFQLSTINAKITKQISDYKQKYNFTYSGILKALVWWYEVKNNPVDDKIITYGIGIVPYIYNDAKTYYYGLWLAQHANTEDLLNSFEIKVEEVIIPSPRQELPRPHLFNII